MDFTAFDAMSRNLGSRPARRTLLRVLGGAALAAPLLAGELAAPEAGAKRRKRRVKAGAGAEHNVRGNKAIMCVNGVTIRVPKRKRKKYLNQGATRGECQNPPICVPNCPAGRCNIDDGCGGTCGCASGTVCAENTCVACSVTCDPGDTPGECGEALGGAISTGGDIYLCPGRYQGGYLITGAVRIHGAGSGDDPATSSIIQGPPTTVSQAIFTFLGSDTHSIENVRITGNNNSTDGGGLRVSSSSTLTLSSSVVVDNHSQNYGGGAIVGGSATLIVENCEFLDNSADSGGGGIESDGALTITSTRISGNTSPFGGGIYIDGGTTTLAASVTITGNHATALSSFPGGGVYVGSGTLVRNGADISGNTPAGSQCEGTGC